MTHSFIFSTLILQGFLILSQRILLFDRYSLTCFNRCMGISKEKIDELAARMERLGVKEGDLIEKFILGSGKGGQKINKTSSCVYLKHLPTGIEVKCQEERSRELNRYRARHAVCNRIEEELFQIKSKKQQETEKIRRQKRRRSRRQKEKMVAEKRIHSSNKSLRKPPSSD